MAITQLNVHYLRSRLTENTITVLVYSNNFCIMISNGNDDINDYAITASCSTDEDTDFKKIPFVHELSEEEYFQYSLVSVVNIELLRAIQQHGIDTINTDGELILQFDKDTYNLLNNNKVFQY